MRSRFVMVFATVVIVLGVGRNGFTQSQSRIPLLPGSTPLVPPDPPSQGNIGGRGRGELLTISDASGRNVSRGNLHHVDGSGVSNKPRVDPDTAGLTTIPHWSDAFTYHGLVYKYTMVGTDPKRGSATTVIPTALIPIRFVFADGNVFDASTDKIDGQTSMSVVTMHRARRI